MDTIAEIAADILEIESILRTDDLSPAARDAWTDALDASFAELDEARRVAR